MRSVRWRKVLRDLGTHPLRSVLVVLSIAVGVFAVGTIAGSDALLQRSMAEGYAASRPASATLFAAPFGFDRAPLFRIDDGVDGFPPREMCLWSREQILSAIK